MRIAARPRAPARVSLCSFRRERCQKAATAGAWRATITCLGTLALVLGATGMASAQPVEPPPVAATPVAPPPVEALPVEAQPVATQPVATQPVQPPPVATRSPVGVVIEAQGFG